MSEDPEGNARPASPAAPDPSLRLRSERPRVTRLSHKVLAGGAAIALVAVSAAVLWALQNNGKRGAPEELYSTDHRTTADGLAGLPRDYAGIPRQAPQLGPRAHHGEVVIADNVGQQQLHAIRCFQRQSPAV